MTSCGNCLTHLYIDTFAKFCIYSTGFPRSMYLVLLAKNIKSFLSVGFCCCCSAVQRRQRDLQANLKRRNELLRFVSRRSLNYKVKPCEADVLYVLIPEVAHFLIPVRNDLSESLTSQDQHICSSLEEKLQIYTELSALSGRMEAVSAEPRLLVQMQSEELPQAAGLLAAALQEGGTQNWKQCRLRSSFTYHFIH